MKKFLFLSICFTSLLYSCIGTDFVDDYVAPQLFFTSTSDSLVVDMSVAFEAKYRNNIGADELVDFVWTSTDDAIATVNASGLVTGVNVGRCTISVSYALDSDTLKSEQIIDVVAEVPELLILTDFVDTLGLDSSYQFKALYRANNGEISEVTINWSSSNQNIVTINENGIATGIAIGNAFITASYDNGSEILMLEHPINIAETTIIQLEQRTGTINTTSSYDLFGDFTLIEQLDGRLRLSFTNNYIADTGLPGLYVYLTNNRNSNAPSAAIQIAKVTVFNGAHSYLIPEGIEIDDYQYVLYYCKPFNVKVGDGLIN